MLQEVLLVSQSTPSPPSHPFFIPVLHLPHISRWQRLMTVPNEQTFFFSSSWAHSVSETLSLVTCFNCNVHGGPQQPHAIHSSPFTLSVRVFSFSHTSPRGRVYACFQRSRIPHRLVLIDRWVLKLARATHSDRHFALRSEFRLY